MGHSAWQYATLFHRWVQCPTGGCGCIVDVHHFSICDLLSAVRSQVICDWLEPGCGSNWWSAFTENCANSLYIMWRNRRVGRFFVLGALWQSQYGSGKWNGIKGNCRGRGWWCQHERWERHALRGTLGSLNDQPAPAEFAPLVGDQ